MSEASLDQFTKVTYTIWYNEDAGVYRWTTEDGRWISPLISSESEAYAWRPEYNEDGSLKFHE